MKSIHRRIIKTYDSHRSQKSCALHYYETTKQKTSTMIRKTKIVQVQDTIYFRQKE